MTVDIALDITRLVELDKAVDHAENNGIRARWEFGRDLLARREGKLLPRGLLADLVKATGTGRRELQRRMQFAEVFPTEAELRHAVTQFGSWHDIVNDALAGDRDDDSHEPGPLPEGSYRTIVADPPWRYDNRATRGAAEDHYSTMTIAELCDLPVADSAAPDAHLYLWTTNGFLHEAFGIVEAWGFEYKTCLTWVKPQMGMGNYFRSSTEHVLFGVHGSLRTHDRTLVNWFQASRKRHSAKPESFYDLVEKASPGPYLELFARRARFGWDYWGNQSLETAELADVPEVERS